MAMMAGIGFGCQQHSETLPVEDEVLVQVGDSSLKLHYILDRLPSGLSEEDSLYLFNSLADRWTLSMVLTTLAQGEGMDLESIEAKTADYRNSLIIERFLESKAGDWGKVPASDIVSYYEANKDEMSLEAPIVKGVYIKVAESENRLADVRRWIKSSTPSAIDNLEKYGMRQALQYDLFQDRWLDWNAVAEQIPYRFYDADAFLKSTRDFETRYGGYVYLLHISEYLPSGSTPPFDYASRKIETMLTRERTFQDKRQLLREIYADAIKKGVLRPGSYNPLKPTAK